MPVDWNRLAVFHQIFRHRNLSRTAEALRVSQSAISQSLARLEEETGTQLFYRAGREMRPTPEATALFETVDPFARELENRLSRPGGSLQTEPLLPTGNLRVGAPTEFGSHQLAEKIGRFSHAYPEVRFEVTLDHSDRLALQLLEGRLDFAFVDFFPGGVAARSSFESKVVFSEKLVLVGSRRFVRDRVPSGLALRERLLLPHVSYGPGHPELLRWYQVHFKRKHVRIHVTATVEGVRAIRTLIRSGAGLGILPEYIADNDISSGALKVIPGATGREIENSILLLRLKNRRATVAERLFIQNFNGN